MELLKLPTPTNKVEVGAIINAGVPCPFNFREYQKLPDLSCTFQIMFVKSSEATIGAYRGCSH